MNAAVTHLLEVGKSSNIFAGLKALQKELLLYTDHMYFRVRHVQVIATALSDGPIYFFFHIIYILTHFAKRYCCGYVLFSHFPSIYRSFMQTHRGRDYSFTVKRGDIKHIVGKV